MSAPGSSSFILADSYSYGPATFPFFILLINNLTMCLCIKLCVHQLYHANSAPKLLKVTSATKL